MAQLKSCYLIRKIGQSIEETFLLSPAHFCKKVLFNSISRAGEREEGGINLLLCEQEREDGLIKSWPYSVFQYSSSSDQV